jgi:hypothetical protein
MSAIGCASFIFISAAHLMVETEVAIAGHHFRRKENYLN